MHRRLGSLCPLSRYLRSAVCLAQRTEELSVLRKEHAALKATSDANAARVATLGSQLSHSGGDGASAASAALVAKDEELAALRTRTSDMILKIERLESECVTMRIMAERSAAKIEAVRQDNSTERKTDPPLCFSVSAPSPPSHAPSVSVIVS